MISTIQKKEIREYLLSRELSLDILLEVEDHFLSQIEYDQSDKNYSFQEAFENVKQNWKADLKLVKYYNGSAISVFAKRIRDKEINKLLLKSVMLTFILVSGIYLLAIYTDKDDFTDLITYLFIIVLGFPALHYFVNIKMFRLCLKYKPMKMNIFQNTNKLLLICGLMIICSGSAFQKTSERIFDFIENESKIGLASFLMVTVFAWFYSFGFLSQIAFVKTLKKMKPFLRNFKTQE